MATKQPPLHGIRILDFGHTVMGPCCGAILADLGAEVIKVEPVGLGDPTRHLKGFGSGYFGYFARNKKSISIDLKSDEGAELARALVSTADVLIENFAPGTMERMGLGYEQVKSLNEKLIYTSLKGFLPGPYENRLALDEVVQMMCGLGYMTGPTGRPLRAGTSVVDITGGMFGVIGVLVALNERARTGQGQKVETALFESLVYLMGQHLCYASQSESFIPPMPERVSAWAIYQIFDTKDGKQLFLGLTTDNHWQRFCKALEWLDFLEDPDLKSNNQRIAAKDQISDRIRATLSEMTLEEASRVLEDIRVPFAPVQRPEDLFDDPHLLATDGLVETQLPDGTITKLPRVPLKLTGSEFGAITNPPEQGAHTREILEAAGVEPEAIERAIVAGALQVACEAGGA